MDRLSAHAFKLVRQQQQAYYIMAYIYIGTSHPSSATSHRHQVSQHSHHPHQQPDNSTDSYATHVLTNTIIFFQALIHIDWHIQRIQPQHSYTSLINSTQQHHVIHIYASDLAASRGGVPDVPRVVVPRPGQVHPGLDLPRHRSVSLILRLCHLLLSSRFGIQSPPCQKKILVIHCTFCSFHPLRVIGFGDHDGRVNGSFGYLFGGLIDRRAFAWCCLAES